jgi:lambda repressor-like predicted transcriptional regulator
MYITVLHTSSQRGPKKSGFVTLLGIPSFHDVFRPLLAGIRMFTTFCFQLRKSETLANVFRLFAVQSQAPLPLFGHGSSVKRHCLNSAMAPRSSATAFIRPWLLGQAPLPLFGHGSSVKRHCLYSAMAPRSSATALIRPWLLGQAPLPLFGHGASVKRHCLKSAMAPRSSATALIRPWLLGQAPLPLFGHGSSVKNSLCLGNTSTGRANRPNLSVFAMMSRKHS